MTTREFIEEMTDQELVEFLRNHVRLQAMVLTRRLNKRPTMSLSELLADITMSELMETLDDL